MRCKVTNVKMNMKGLYDNHECEVCLSDEETQKHIYECKEIWKIRGTNFKKLPQYENIQTGNLKEQLEVAKIFQENLDILEKVKSEKSNK